MRKIEQLTGLACVVLGMIGVLSAFSAISYWSWQFMLGGGEKAENAMVFYGLGPSVPHWFLWLFPLVLFFFRHEAISLIGEVVEAIGAD